MFLSGRLDTTTAPQFERKIKQLEDDMTELILDFSELTYISSMGLRVLLQTHKAMSAKKQKLVIQNLGESIREVFEMTGFISLLLEEERFVVIRKDEPDMIRLSLIGHLVPAKVPMLTKELGLLRDANMLKGETLRVVLDAEKLTYISGAACHLLKEAITESDWKYRKLSIENAPAEIWKVFCNEGLGGSIGVENPA
jgi:anti-sigma B factor antagonist